MKANRGVIRWLALLAVATLNSQLITVFAQSVTFTTNTYAVGFPPICVAAADINGDGKPDLICGGGNGVSDILMVLTNNGSGGFGSNTAFNLTIYSPTCVVATDVNGDGKPDLICLCGSENGRGPGVIIVLTNNGSGDFGVSPGYVLPSGINVPLSVMAVADVNGDGKPDLICPSQGFNLFVLTNNGSGVFGLNATPSVDGVPYCVVAADVNGDEAPDLICAAPDRSALTVLTNNGDGVFGSNGTNNVGSVPVCVVAADINGDGKPDLISVNEADNTLTVLTNSGGGVFGSNATYNVGSKPVCVVAADLNGDGEPDLICANYTNNTLTVLTNNGSGGFSFNATLNVGRGPQGVIAADVNSDGKLDLISVDHLGGTLTVLINTTPFPVPTLNITSTGNQIALYWPTSATNYVLESTTNLCAPNWMAVTNGIPITGGVTLTNSWPAVFFRLHQL